MDVVIANKQSNNLNSLDTDIIKNVSGEYEALEISNMFQDFFFDRIIIDVTAIKSNEDINSYQTLIDKIDPDKIIFLLPEGSKICTPSFLNRLISMGIYNFTTNVNGVSYLLKKPNTFKEVEHITKMVVKKEEVKEPESVPEPVPEKVPETVPETAPPKEEVVASPKPVDEKQKPFVLGVRNVTNSAGATTLIYMMLKELSLIYGHEGVLAIEIDKNDFSYFYEKRMVSVKENEFKETLDKNMNLKVILVDLNQCKLDSLCNDIVYLVEPSTYKLNRLIRKNKIIFQELANRKVVLNQSILQNNDVFDFESEAGIKIFYNMPPLDDRKRNSVIADFLSRIGLISSSEVDGAGKIFGLFRR